MRLFWILISVLLAAGVAALLVVPEEARLKDVIGWEPAPEDELPDVALKDDSRVPGVDVGADAPAAPAGEAQAGSGVPELQPIRVDQVPFETACGLFLTPPDSRDVIFIQPESTGEQATAVAALSVEGQLVLLRRGESSGESFGRGAFTRQLFRNQEGTVTVVSQLRPQAPGEGGRITVESGELTVMMAGRPTLKLPVGGAAGC